MTMKTMLKRLTATFLALSVLVLTLPTLVFPAVATEPDTRVADASSMDDWTDHFGADVLSTRNAGGVWTDKSVFTNADAFDGTGITFEENRRNFLVALSAIASNTSVTGLTNVPTDTMLVLDLSSSMYLGSTRDPFTVQTMLQSVNHVMDELQALNQHNRVGVVVYFGGGDYLPSQTGSAKVLLPLDRYTYSGGDTAYTYLKATLSNGKLMSVDVNTNVTNAAGATVSGNHTVANVAGTYAQLGILNALDEMLAADPIVPAGADYATDQTRIPIMVLMSDGEPTAATANYTAKETAGMGNNTVSFRNAAQTDFVTQLTAAYAKECLDEHYKATEPLFYTLSLGTDISLDVMDPKNNDTTSLTVLADPDSYTGEQLTDANTNRTIDAYWDLLLNDGHVNITVQNCKGQWNATKVDVTYTVSKTTVTEDGQAIGFPTDKTSKYYVDEAFAAADAGGLAEAFESIVGKIELQSHYFPTLVEKDEDISGYITLVDQIGDYMSVTDIKGILIDNTLFSGAMLSRNFVTGGGDLGTFDNPTNLGDELVWAVQARLGVDVNTARDLLGLAYSHGQLSYTSDTEFSNYIGWYANAGGEFLGFWYEGITTMPDPADPTLTDATRPAYIMRSYGFLGAVDEAYGVVESDMMYATVQIRENIVTGDETITFAVPAALIPVTTYNVTLDQEGVLEDLNVTGATHPIRLVYEVALDEAINENTVTALVDSDYVHKNADGTYDFYTNAFETDNSVGYGKVNTYSLFVPSYQNERYYYTEDAVIYTDTNGTRYTGEAPAADGIYYRAYKVYSREHGLSTDWVYEKISSLSLAKASRHDDGYWYIPAGTVHTMLEDYVVEKAVNATESLTFANNPFVDTQYNYYVGATLGNNGRVTLVPATGIKLSKTLDVPMPDPDAEFVFTIERTDAEDNAEYAAFIQTADGESIAQTVTFADSIARVTLKHGQTLYITGMTADAVYRITEQAHPAYTLASINGAEDVKSLELTLEAMVFAEAAFVNREMRYGRASITKLVSHDFGLSYELPDKSYEILVDLGEGYANTALEAAHSVDQTVTSVQTDENGRFTIFLKHAEQFELTKLREGTVVAATEINPPEGFYVKYYGAGKEGVNWIEVDPQQPLSIVVGNHYTSTEIKDVPVKVQGSKLLLGRENNEWLDTDIYQFELQKNVESAWHTIATATVDKNNRSFDFSEAMAAESFSTPGSYSYQVLETLGSVKGVSYDRNIHTFTVIVGDPDMTGLRVLDVVSHEDDHHITGSAAEGWTVTTGFTNTYSTGGSASVAMDINKRLENPAGSDRVDLSGFRFGLYEDGAKEPMAVSAYTDMVGEARLVVEFDTVGTYVYTLKEIVPDDPIPGMQYSTEEYTVEIVVSDDTDGTISAVVTVADGNGAAVGTNPIFTNRYELTEAELTPTVSKELTGRALRDGEFHFQILQNGRVIRTGTNLADGTVAFESPLVFTEIGDYDFDIVEVAGQTPGITYDTTVYRMRVRVVDGGDGALNAHYHILNAANDAATFRNRYEAAPVPLVLKGTKTLVGRGLINDEFAFVLIEQNTEDGLVLGTRNYADGTFAFDPIVYDTAGWYYYTICEVHSSTTHGIDFDESTYHVTVHVYDDGDGQLKVEYTIVKEGESVDSIAFTNHYKAAPVSIELIGTKTLTGRALGDGEFTFVLCEMNEAWQEIRTVETITNAADGKIVFTPVVIADEGTYRYVVKEQHGGETIDNVTYDDEYYRVLVVVTDNGRGNLVAQQAMLNSHNEYSDTLVFENTYTSTPPTTTTTTVDTPSTTTTTTVTTTTAVETTTTVPQTTGTTSTDSPDTGEELQYTLWFALLFVSGAVVMGLAINGKKKQNT